jgi:hypothetical protein
MIAGVLDPVAKLGDVVEFGRFVQWLWHALIQALATFDTYGTAGLLAVPGLIFWVVLRWFRR